MHPTHLIQQIQQSGPEALQHVYNHCKKYCISRLCSTTACPPDAAEDIFMDAILIFYENVKLGKLTEVRHLRAYLYKICQNRYYELQHQQECVRRAKDHIHTQWYEYEIPSDDIAQKKALVMQAYRYLGENCRRVLHYYYFDHLTLEDIAQKMGLANVQVVKVTKSRCYKKWREAVAALKQKKNV